jgi:hypothetical protein
MRHLIASMTGLAALLSAATSSAQIGEAGDLVLGFERMFGIHWWHNDYDPDRPGDGGSSSGTVVGFGWHRHEGSYNAPRVGFDGFIIDQLSLGGSLGFYNIGGDAEGDGVILYPRVGYAIPLSTIWACWLRGGVSYSDINNWTRVALSTEGQFLVFPQPSWAVMFGPTLDLGLGGSAPNGDFTDHNLGLQVGGIGVF